MALLSGIYDGGPIAPVARIKENVSIWTVGNWQHYRIDYIEGMPGGSTMIAELVTISGATTIAANGTIAQQLLAILQLRDRELLHLRWEPLDDVEGILWEQAGTGRFVTRGVHSRVNLFTRTRDPNLATTTFFILGRDKDMNLEARNPNPVALPMARFAFVGFRYVLKALSASEVVEIEGGRKTTTWLPAEGRAN